MSVTKRGELERLLEIHKQTKLHWETQKAQHGILAPPAVEHGLREACDQIARVEKELAGIVPDNAIHVDLWTREGANPHTPGAQQLDWTSYFATNPPSADLWNQNLMPQLRALLNLCGEDPSRTLALHLKAHISAAIALGYTFTTSLGYQLWVEQKQDEWWRADIITTESPMLTEQMITINARRPEFSVEISIARDIHADVEDAIMQLGLPIGHRIQLSTDQLPGKIHNAEQAKAIAEQVRGAIVRARSRSRRLPIHLFAAVPVALAVLIGAHLSACNPIQCYEHRRDQGDYVPACLLRG